MNIRTRITVTFFTIVIIVLTAITMSIYFFSANYREADFFRRLKNRAMNTAQVLVEVEEINAELLGRMQRNNPANLPDQRIAIYEPDGRVLYSSHREPAIPVDETLLADVHRRKEIKYRHKAYEVIAFEFTGNDITLIVVAAATDVYGIDALSNLRNVLLITFGVSVIFVSAMGWIYAGRVLRPIKQIVNEVSKITEANLSQRLNEGNKKDELGKLASTFNRMLGRLQAAFAAQKHFIANASHEIKTPITVMSGEIEVTLLQDRDKAYYVKALRSVLTGLRGLNRLSGQLLLLAQTSADQPEKNFNPLRVDDVLWAVKEEILKAHPEYKIEIAFNLNLNHEALLIDGDEQLMKVAIFNLMDNGCKYSDDGAIYISLSSANSRDVVIDFTNKGSGIDSDQAGRIFDPFVRGRNVQNVKGFGIGLSLVKRIIELHSGTISVESLPQISTRFTVTIPCRSV